MLSLLFLQTETKAPSDIVQVDFRNIFDTIAQILSITHEMIPLDPFIGNSERIYSTLCNSADTS